MLLTLAIAAIPALQEPVVVSTNQEPVVVSTNQEPVDRTAVRVRKQAGPLNDTDYYRALQLLQREAARRGDAQLAAGLGKRVAELKSQGKAQASEGEVIVVTDSGALRDEKGNAKKDKGKAKNDKYQNKQSKEARITAIERQIEHLEAQIAERRAELDRLRRQPEAGVGTTAPPKGGRVKPGRRDG